MTKTHKRDTGRIFGPFSLLLASICLTGGIITTLPANAADTGIRGTVLWGPVHGGPVRLGQSDEAPLRAIFHVLDSEHEVARFESDGKGSFEVLLSAGDYTIVPDKSTPIPAPQSQAKTVTVPEDGFAAVTLRFDTGLR